MTQDLVDLFNRERDAKAKAERTRKVAEESLAKAERAAAKLFWPNPATLKEIEDARQILESTRQQALASKDLTESN